jgi:hypothetical protein
LTRQLRFLGVDERLRDAVGVLLRAHEQIPQFLEGEKGARRRGERGGRASDLSVRSVGGEELRMRTPNDVASGPPRAPPPRPSNARAPS